MNYTVIRGKDEGMEVIHDCMNGDVLSHSTIVNTYTRIYVFSLVGGSGGDLN